MNGFDREELEALDDLFAKHSRFQNYRHYAEAFATYSPSLFVVINFQRFGGIPQGSRKCFHFPDLSAVGGGTLLNLQKHLPTGDETSPHLI